MVTTAEAINNISEFDASKHYLKRDLTLASKTGIGGFVNKWIVRPMSRLFGKDVFNAEKMAKAVAKLETHGGTNLRMISKSDGFARLKRKFTHIKLTTKSPVAKKAGAIFTRVFGMNKSRNDLSKAGALQQPERHTQQARYKAYLSVAAKAYDIHKDHLTQFGISSIPRGIKDQRLRDSAFRQMEVLSEGLEVVKHSKNTFGPYGTTRYKIVEYFLASKGFPRTTSTIRDILNEECRKLDKKDAPRTSANSSGGSYFGGGGSSKYSNDGYQGGM